MINALSSDYRGVYYVDLDKNEGICYQPYEHLDNALKQGEHFSYKETFESYAKKYVSDKLFESIISSKCNNLSDKFELSQNEKNKIDDGNTSIHYIEPSNTKPYTRIRLLFSKRKK